MLVSRSTAVLEIHLWSWGIVKIRHARCTQKLCAEGYKFTVPKWRTRNGPAVDREIFLARLGIESSNKNHAKLQDNNSESLGRTETTVTQISRPHHKHKHRLCSCYCQRPILLSRGPRQNWDFIIRDEKQDIQLISIDRCPICDETKNQPETYEKSKELLQLIDYGFFYGEIQRESHEKGRRRIQARREWWEKYGGPHDGPKTYLQMLVYQEYEMLLVAKWYHVAGMRYQESLKSPHKYTEGTHQSCTLERCNAGYEFRCPRWKKGWTWMSKAERERAGLINKMFFVFNKMVERC